MKNRVLENAGIFPNFVIGEVIPGAVGAIGATRTVRCGSSHHHLMWRLGGGGSELPEGLRVFEKVDFSSRFQPFIWTNFPIWYTVRGYQGDWSHQISFHSEKVDITVVLVKCTNNKSSCTVCIGHERERSCYALGFYGNAITGHNNLKQQAS